MGVCKRCPCPECDPDETAGATVDQLRAERDEYRSSLEEIVTILGSMKGLGDALSAVRGMVCYLEEKRGDD